MEEFTVRSISLQQVQNQTSHKTEGLSSTTVVLRRGQAFTVAINYDGRPFDPLKEKMIFSITLGPVTVDVPVSRLGQPSLTQWTAVLESPTAPGPTAPRVLSVSLSSPASASIGVYTLQLRVETRLGVGQHSVGQITLLCNPWSQADSVYLQSEDLRTEYVKSDNGVLFIGSAGNIFARPWSFDQYEKGILDICMKLLQLSPQYRADMRKDLQKSSNPVYIGRVISAMVNSNDDKGVVMGNWSGNYSDGVSPSMWTGSADILKKWAETQFRPVRYGQCWVFAAVMCTVMRALGIPTRVITNFNSAHDTDGNMVIEEYYDENGRKLSISSDSIWNFHVWVESWMKRPDLGRGYDGWQVLDATPQERSGGTFRCGPASVKAVYQQKVEAQYDVPFVYAEVNADVHEMIVRDGKVLSKTVDTRRVGALILTKLPGSMRRQDVTSEYKNERADMAFHALSTAGASKGVTVSLKLLNPPVVGENISFNVVITNNEAAPKQLKKHVNAQNKEYNRNPTGTFWEAHDDVKIGPNETVTAKHEITFKEYMLKEAADVFLVNLAVVIEDVKSQEKVLASEEFNIRSPTLNVQIQNESSVKINAAQVATVNFMNPFNTAVSGELTISGSGLLEEKAKMRVTIQPRETMKKPIDFTPRMAGFKLQSINLQQVQNQIRHKTDGLSSSTLVLRRGQAFTVLLSYEGRPFDPMTEKLIFRIILGPLSVEVPVSMSGQPSPTQWSAILERGVSDPTGPRALSVSLSSPASASVGVYTLQLRVENRWTLRTYLFGQFTLLCNPWSQADSVFLPSEDLRNEYVRNDFGLLFKGSPGNIAARPWSFDQYEKGILDICMKLLQLSPQYQADMGRDLQNRSNPVYIGRVISAMVNSNDDRGVLAGNWSGEYSDGVNPSKWSGSADILRMWAETQFKPVKYGQCWVFAAVMCTVMRALGIPTRVITNFNSAHDTNNNMVIEEYYSEMGEKLSFGKDSIWNFHVWVESWMKRPDLGQGYDGWQVLDPTPQERSGGTFRCGPAAVKAVYQQKVDVQYDVPFVYAEVNADVHIMIVKDGKVLSTSVDKKRVGALICTKYPGAMRMQDVTSEYKNERGESMMRAMSSTARSGEGATGRMAPKGVAVSLQLLKAPVVGENISFNVIITNTVAVPKLLRKHVNAQNKEYNRNPTRTLWEAHDDLKIGPNETVTIKHEIPFNNYMMKEAEEDYLVNLTVVIEDVKSQERVLATEEFNIRSPTLNVQIQNENVSVNTQQVATVNFTNPFSVPVSGELTVACSGLQERFQTRLTVQPRETMKIPVSFTPRLAGAKMIYASLVLRNPPIILHGFKTINVQAS
ncbi:glutamine gamma-glutamyltransferase [Labeo rohita]|uniref:protein-glutamine gamma-glutamyltransferase n=1 Tax=Labeo rohita TaxID=84645 RepID=A0A498NKK2_LABRO|nr:glutamine gamma-glutamyltransferase [Labeo rohita]